MAGFHRRPNREEIRSRLRSARRQSAPCGMSAMLLFVPPTCLAKAVYDNVAETQEELSFKRGDVVTVVEQDTRGLEGWWLCSLKGRKGIAPGNRLKLITGMTQEPPPNSNMASTELAKSKKNWRRSWDIQQNNKVVTPQRLGDVYVYDQGQGSKTNTDYDVPPTRYFQTDTTGKSPKNVNDHPAYDTPAPPSSRTSGASFDDQDVYDVPPSQRSSSYEPPSNRSSSISMLSSGSVMSTSTSNTSFQSPSLPGSARSSSELNPQDIYDVPPMQNYGIRSPHRSSDSQRDSPIKRSSDGNISHQPTKSVDSGIYDAPPIGQTLDVGGFSSTKFFSGSLETLKSQKISTDMDYDTPSEFTVNKSFGSRSSILDSDTYDVPRSNTPVGFGSNRSSRSSFNDQSSVYDIPPQVTRDTPILRKCDSQCSMDSLEVGLRRLSTSSMSSGSDIPYIPYEELHYELDAAMDLLIKLQQDLQAATNRLLTFVMSSTWRSKNNLENNVYNIKTSCEQVMSALKQFLDFGQGALANSAKAADKNLVQKLYRAVKPLQEHSACIGQCLGALEKLGWQVSELVKVTGSPLSVETDPLGQIVAVSTNIVGDARILVSVIQGNSTLLFKRIHKIENKPPVAPKTRMERSATPERRSSFQDRPLPATPQTQRVQSLHGNNKPPLPPGTLARKSSKENIIDDNDYENDTRDWVDEYDYVQLHQGKEGVEKQKKGLASLQKETSPVIISPEKDNQKVTDNQMNNFMGSVPLAAPNVGNSSGLIPSDKQLLLFYSNQIIAHANVLNGAIDSFFNCIECNQPPKVFVAHSKFVVLNAHKMVYIGDTLHRNLMHVEVRNRIMHSANYLCETLKQTVIATKTAALQYPSVVAVQDMVDRIVDVSHAAHEVKVVVTQTANG